MKKFWKIGTIAVVVLIILVIVLMKGRKVEENGNIANMGLAVEKNGVVYYNKYEKGIFARKDGKEKQLTDETAYSINLVKNKLYYLTIANFNNVVVKSVDITGENLKNIATIYTSISKFFVEDNFIYYATNREEKGIVRRNLEGETENLVIADDIQDFQVVDGKIFYLNAQNQICKIATSGEDSGMIAENVNAHKIQVVDGWIYYYDEIENALFRYQQNGKKKELVSVLVNHEIYNVAGKYVYYLDKEKSKLCRMQIENSNHCEELVDIQIAKTKINVAGNELYYLDKSQDESQTYQMYCMNVKKKETIPIEY